MSSANLAFIADCHVANFKKFGGATRAGVNARAALTLDTLTHAVAHAEKGRVNALVVCGDLFDSVRPEPQLQARVAQLFAESGLITIVLRGNHETVSATPGDHALGPVGAADGVMVIEAPHYVFLGDDTALLCVPYRPGNAREWFLPAVRELSARCDANVRVRRKLLAFHLGVEDQKTTPFLQGAHDSVDAYQLAQVMADCAIDAAFAGNWHDHKSWSINVQSTGTTHAIVQCGALVPTGFNNPGLEGYGGLIEWNSHAGTWSRTEMPGPRFLKVEGEDGFAEAAYRTAAAQVPGGRLFVQWTTAPSALGATAALLAHDELAYGLGGYEVRPHEAALQQAKAFAAAGARAASASVDGAVDAYVDAMSLDDLVEREDVRARVRAYLR